MFRTTTDVVSLDDNIYRTVVSGPQVLNLGAEGAAYLCKWGLAMETGLSFEEVDAEWEPHPEGAEWSEDMVLGAVGTGGWVLDWLKINEEG